MTTETVMDKVVDNKLLTVVGRVGMTLTILLLPMLIGWFVSIGNDLDAYDRRLTIIETQASNSTLPAQVEELRRQNTLILQAIARLEAKLEVQAQQTSTTRQ